MLPFEPETTKLIHDRAQGALFDMFYATEVDTRRADMFRKHVFDFEDGLRIVAWREQPKNDMFEKHMVHFTGSFEGLNIQEPENAIRLIKGRIKRNFGYKVAMPNSISEKGV